MTDFFSQKMHRREDVAERPDSGRPGKNTLEDVSSLDRKILALLARRARLYEDMLKASAPNRAVSSALNLDKQLWAVWEEDAVRYGHDPSLWRKFFYLLQSFRIRAPETDADRSHGFILNPKTKALDLTVTGPPDVLMSRFWVALAALCPVDGHIDSLSRNDALSELCGGLNQLGASLVCDKRSVSWSALVDDASIRGDKSVHVGNDLFNLYIIACRLMLVPGRFKIIAGDKLGSVDFAELGRLTPRLGARLVTNVPHGRATSLRLENSAELPEILPAGDFSDEFLAALLLSAPALPQGLSLSGVAKMGFLAEKAISALNDWGVETVKCSERMEIKPARLSIPKEMSPDMDPFLTPYLAALVLGAGGQITLEGHWPKGLKGPGPLALGMLKACGAILNRTAKRLLVISGPAPEEGELSLQVGPWARFLPLALFLAVYFLDKNQKASRVIVETDFEIKHPGQAQEFLERLACQAECVENSLIITRLDEAPAQQFPWVSPSAYWSMALALASFFKRGVSLANPGMVTALYPEFWPLYNGLSKRLDSRDPDRKEADEIPAPKRGRRIKV